MVENFLPSLGPFTSVCRNFRSDISCRIKRTKYSYSYVIYSAKIKKKKTLKRAERSSGYLFHHVLKHEYMYALIIMYHVQYCAREGYEIYPYISTQFSRILHPGIDERPRPLLSYDTMTEKVQSSPFPFFFSTSFVRLHTKSTLGQSVYLLHLPSPLGVFYV